MEEVRYWWSELMRRGKDRRLPVYGQELIASCYDSLESYVASAKRNSIDELLTDIDMGVELPYNTADYVTDRIIWTLFRVLEALIPPDPDALTLETVCNDTGITLEDGSPVTAEALDEGGHGIII